MSDSDRITSSILIVEVGIIAAAYLVPGSIRRDRDGVELPDDAEVIVEATRQRYYRDDAVRWVWIFYGLAQATITMLIAFDVVETLTPAEIVTAVALIVYVGVNEVLVRPYRSRPSDPPPPPAAVEAATPPGTP